MKSMMVRRLLPGLALALLVAPHAWAGDFEDCRDLSGAAAIAACDRGIGSGAFAGRRLAELYNNRGMEYYIAQDDDRALADFTRGIAVDGTYALVVGNRGNVHHRRDALAAALADYSEAIRLDPQFPAAFTSRGRVYRKMGDEPKARRDFETALSLPVKYGNGQWAHDTARKMLNDPALR